MAAMTLLLIMTFAACGNNKAESKRARQSPDSSQVSEVGAWRKQKDDAIWQITFYASGEFKSEDNVQGGIIELHGNYKKTNDTIELAVKEVVVDGEKIESEEEDGRNIRFFIKTMTREKLELADFDDNGQVDYDNSAVLYRAKADSSPIKPRENPLGDMETGDISDVADDEEDMTTEPVEITDDDEHDEEYDGDEYKYIRRYE